MLATCRKSFEIIFHGSYMRIIPQHVSGHVRDTCMKFMELINAKFPCWLHVDNVSELIMYAFRPQWYTGDTTWKQAKLGAIPPLWHYLDRVLRNMGGHLALGCVLAIKFALMCINFLESARQKKAPCKHHLPLPKGPSPASRIKKHYGDAKNLTTPRPAAEPRDGPTRNFHQKYQKKPAGPKFWTSRTYPENTEKIAKNAHFGYFFGIFREFSRGSRIPAWGIFSVFWWKFGVGPSRGSVAGRSVLNKK